MSANEQIMIPASELVHEYVIKSKIEELEKIKAEMIQERDSVDLSCTDTFNWNIRLIDKHIAELKGENEKC